MMTNGASVGELIDHPTQRIYNALT